MPSRIEPTPLSLLRRLREEPRPEDWDLFVELYTPLLIAWSRRLGLPGDDTRDLVQEIFLMLLHKLGVFRHDGQRRFRGWLWTITLNKVRDRYRQRDVAPPEDVDLEELVRADTVAEYRSHLYAQAIRIMQKDFAETTWRACWLCVVEERPPAEVAQTLQVSVATVYQAKRRVLHRLHQELEGLLE
jgi:RNA polymerase sigma-70 factor (ECF subfamily)